MTDTAYLSSTATREEISATLRNNIGLAEAWAVHDFPEGAGFYPFVQNGTQREVLPCPRAGFSVADMATVDGRLPEVLRELRKASSLALNQVYGWSIRSTLRFWNNDYVELPAAMFESTLTHKNKVYALPETMEIRALDSHLVARFRTPTILLTPSGVEYVSNLSVPAATLSSAWLDVAHPTWKNIVMLAETLDASSHTLASMLLFASQAQDTGLNAMDNFAPEGIAG